ASLWNDRAIAYRERHGLDQKELKIAVVVQRMVPARLAGVLFTVNPVTGARDEMVIESHSGLGEAVVSGMFMPDYFVLRRRLWGWAVTSRRQNRREAAEPVSAIAGTGSLTPTDSELKKLVRLGAAIERHFGRPQDVEWALTEGKLYIVQARPMTALPEPPLHTGWLQKIAAGMAAEFLPERPYPLEITTWTPVPFAALAAMIKPLGLRLPRFEDLFIIEDGVVVKYRGHVKLTLTSGIVLAPFRMCGLARRYNPVRWRYDPLLAKAISLPTELATHDPGSLEWPGLLSTVRDSMTIISPFLGELRRLYVPRAALAIIRLRLEMMFLGHSKRFSALISGVQTKTLETNQALEDLASLVRGDPALSAIFAEHDAPELRAELEAAPRGRDLLSRFDAFLDCYGHRETGSLLLIYQPTWKESPEIVLGIIKELARTEPAPRAERLPWEKARDEVLRHPVLRLPPLRRHFLTLLQEARCFTAIREDTRFYAALPLPVMRQTFLEMGRRLAGAGILAIEEDIFHLTMSELEALRESCPPSSDLAGKLRAAAGRRKSKRAALKETPLVDPRLFRQGGYEGDALVSGSPAGRGVVEGAVRIIRQTSEFSCLRRGEILVAPYTNPAWTPLFQRAAAVVVDTGGAASHAAIVAREYGIPAVMGTTDGTRRLRDGQRVRVDGGQGKVYDAEVR
ncbi:MAG: PEP/pyruvate-binding domain-containing protein, partial [Dehalococcoidales bacterium]|nr:PEP/pyruvate-binding domain-containing protein [Dehalococcoidales bacterium]